MLLWSTRYICFPVKVANCNLSWLSLTERGQKPFSILFSLSSMQSNTFISTNLMHKDHHIMKTTNCISDSKTHLKKYVVVLSDGAFKSLCTENTFFFMGFSLWCLWYKTKVLEGIKPTCLQELIFPIPSIQSGKDPVLFWRKFSAYALSVTYHNPS